MSIGRKHIRRLVVAVATTIVLLFPCQTIRGQCASSTEGTDFWVMFLENWARSEDTLFKELSIVVAASFPTNVTITNPNTDFSTTVFVEGGNVERFVIDSSVGYSLNNWEIGNCGLHVTSDNPISLYSSNFHEFSFDMTLVLPTETLDTLYMVQTPDIQAANEIGFLATEDSTHISFVLPRDIYAPMGTLLHQGDSLSVLLMKGQTYQVSSHSSFSGMTVVSNGKPFVALSGGQCAAMCAGNIPVQSTCDHIYEQLIPLKYWGWNFIVISTERYINGGDAVQVTSSDDNCVLKLNHVELDTLRKGETLFIDLRQTIPDSGGSIIGYYIETSKPSCVMLYMGKDRIYNDTTGEGILGDGDPAMVYIQPTEQGVSNMRFQTINTRVISNHYVNIVVRSSDTSEVSMDGVPLSGFTPLDCGYSFINVYTPEGTHEINTYNSSIVAYVYGRGHAESYAYIAGMALHDLSYRLLANGEDISSLPDNIDICREDSILFQLRTSEPNLSMEWFVDGVSTGINDSIFLFRPTDDGDHNVGVFVPEYCDTISVTLHLITIPDTADLDTIVCAGTLFEIYDFSTADSGQYTIRIPQPLRCKFLNINLGLTTYSDTISLDTVVCQGTTFEIYGFTTTDAGKYIIPIPDTLPNHCSCLDLHLRIKAYPKLNISETPACSTLTTTLHLSIISDTTEPFRWSSSPEDTSLLGHEYDDTLILSPQSTTTYSVNAGNLCPTELSIDIEPLESAIAEILITPEKLEADNYRFTAYDNSHNAQYRQWFINNLPLPYYSNPLIYYANSDTDSILVTLVVGQGPCSDTAQQWLLVHHEELWTPNAFTPSQENNNRFSIITKNIVQEELIIYNRKGLLVFRSSMPTDGWDGTHNGHPCPQDIYVWHLRYHTKDRPNAPHTATGTVTLLR